MATTIELAQAQGINTHLGPVTLHAKGHPDSA
jgi:hypothetical protein